MVYLQCSATSKRDKTKREKKRALSLNSEKGSLTVCPTAYWKIVSVLVIVALHDPLKSTREAVLREEYDKGPSSIFYSEDIGW
ncbi:uncharacterized protein N7473_004220 [Penicillium subrubescens]|uniref:uncharacterized protein n=1 Tax=Penicillium subrubescens TaxID=1316194 RepID=UPI0025455D6D|nr:uncharacterized protein N7473_004220 [Penicillium subrubescens]KAJ5907304.1 hypothetical protein N7473_004220 [Penicillium subrubescens]